MSQIESALAASHKDKEIVLELRQISPYLIQLTYRDVLSCYLVAAQNGFILVDTLLPAWSTALVEAIQSRGFSITHVLLTHAHHDHAGGLEAVHQAWPEAEIALTSREARLLAGDLVVEPSLAEPSEPVRGKYTHSLLKPDRLLEDGDKVGTLQVILTSGHTPGHAAFFDTRDGTLLAGDAFQTLGAVVVAGTELPHFPQPARATWSKDLALQSARKLAALSPIRLAVAHGPVLEQPLPLMEQAILTSANELGHNCQVSLPDITTT